MRSKRSRRGWRHRSSRSSPGVVVDAQGYIVTNAHVVAGARRVQVVLPLAPGALSGRRSIVRPAGRTVDAAIVGIDRETDLAVLKVARQGLPALAFADSDDLRQGQLVFAFGSPLGLENTMTTGVVSAIGRQRGPADPMVYLQTDAPINPGSSGGALVDAGGRLVGISTFILTQSGGNEGLGFAAPSNIVRTVFEQIRASGRVRRGTLGVHAQTITPLIAAGVGLPVDSGVVLGDVYPGGPAGAAGLEAGDVVLTLDGKPMENARQLDVNVYRRRVGDTVEIEYLRNGVRRRTTAAVAERDGDPERFADLVDPEENLLPRIGILGIEVTAAIRAWLPRLRAPGGVVVAARAADAPAADQPLEPGDVILAVNGSPVAGLPALRGALAAIPPRGACVLHVQRGQRLMFVALELE
jgi:serine protease Do